MIQVKWRSLTCWISIKTEHRLCIERSVPFGVDVFEGWLGEALFTKLGLVGKGIRGSADGAFCERNPTGSGGHYQLVSPPNQQWQNRRLQQHDQPNHPQIPRNPIPGLSLSETQTGNRSALLEESRFNIAIIYGNYTQAVFVPAMSF